MCIRDSNTGTILTSTSWEDTFPQFHSIRLQSDLQSDFYDLGRLSVTLAFFHTGSPASSHTAAQTERNRPLGGILWYPVSGLLASKVIIFLRHFHTHTSIRAALCQGVKVPVVTSPMPPVFFSAACSLAHPYPFMFPINMASPKLKNRYRSRTASL